MEDLEPALAWVRAHREVREVLVSGGDPLVAPDRWIEALLGAIRAIDHVEIIRVGTRVLTACPGRITKPLCRLLARHGPVYLLTHLNHPAELGPEAQEACAMLADAGIPMANQAVLLKNVNDSKEIQSDLSRALLRARVRPYYLMQCDAAAGTAHFRVPITEGIELLESLRRTTTGLGIPTYVLDLPGGAGKVPLGRSSIIEVDGRQVHLLSPRGERIIYEDGQK